MVIEVSLGSDRNTKSLKPPSRPSRVPRTLLRAAASGIKRNKLRRARRREEAEDEGGEK